MCTSSMYVHPLFKINFEWKLAVTHYSNYVHVLPSHCFRLTDVESGFYTCARDAGNKIYKNVQPHNTLYRGTNRLIEKSRSCTIVNRVFWFVNDSVTSSCTIFPVFKSKARHQILIFFWKYKHKAKQGFVVP
jgi:hypothetical protein